MKKVNYYLSILLLFIVFGCQKDDEIPLSKQQNINAEFFEYNGSDPVVSEMILAIKSADGAEKFIPALRALFGNPKWDIVRHNQNIKQNSGTRGEARGSSEERINSMDIEAFVPLAFDSLNRVNAMIGWRKLKDGTNVLRVFDRENYEKLTEIQTREYQPKRVGSYLLLFENEMYGTEKLNLPGMELTLEEKGVLQAAAPDGTENCDTVYVYSARTYELLGFFYINCVSYDYVIEGYRDEGGDWRRPGSGSTSDNTSDNGVTYYDPSYANTDPSANSNSNNNNNDGEDYSDNIGHYPLVGGDRLQGEESVSRVILRGPWGNDRLSLTSYITLISQEFRSRNDTRDLAISLEDAVHDSYLTDQELYMIAKKAQKIYNDTFLVNFQIDILSHSEQAFLAREAAFIDYYPEIKRQVQDSSWPLTTEEWGALWNVFKPMLGELLIEAIPGGGITLAFRDIVDGFQGRDAIALTAGLVALIVEFVPPGKVFKAVWKTGRVVRKGFKFAKYGRKHLNAIANGLEAGLKADLDGAIVKLTKNGDEIARISDNILTFNYTGFGGKIVTNPNKTTTVVGKWADPSGGGTREIIESGLSKSGTNIGGINALNVNTDGLSSSQIWNDVNKPWLEAAIARGDAIRAVSNPNISSNLVNPTTFNGLSYFGMEHEYLVNTAKYTYNPVTKLYTR
tara:strand:- start:186238 stop:188277 length:2040 start_codon:yes stop_codon:yes gene_type:complete